MKWIEKLRNYMEAIITRVRYKILPDGKVVDEISEIVENDKIPTGKIVNDCIKSEEKREEVLVKHAEDLKPGEVNGVIGNLPPESQVSAYKENEIIGKKLARARNKENLRVILNARGINSYRELYQLIESGINDYELVDMLESIEKNQEKQYDSEQVLKIISKQMVLYIQRYGQDLGGHVEELLKALRTEEEKKRVPEIVERECEIKARKLIRSRKNYNKLTEEQREKKIEELKRRFEEGAVNSKEWSEWKPLVNIKGYQSEALKRTIDGILDFEKSRIAERNLEDKEGELRD